MALNCPADTEKGQGNPWYAGQTGWSISAAFVLATFIITCINVARHASNYRAPKEQRQIIRILYLPLVYGSISFLSYRFIDEYVYLSLLSVVYEALAICSFLYLMIQYVVKSTATGTMEEVLATKDKARLPPPWCCFRYRPTKLSFMHLIKWLVLQFVIIRPTISTISIICHALGALCPSSMSPVYPNLWLTIFDTQTMVVAMFGLLIFYTVNRKELNGHRPILKFAVIKLVVLIPMTQEFVFKIIASSGVFEPTQHWSINHVSEGLTAFASTIEMTVFSIIMLWAYSASEYCKLESPKGTAMRAIIDSINIADVVTEMKHSSAFVYSHIRNRPRAKSMDRSVSLDVTEIRVNGVINESATSMGMSGGVPKKFEMTKEAV